MELLKYISKQDCKENDEAQCEDVDIGNEKNNEKEEDKDASFVFKESMLNEFVVKNKQFNVK